MALSGGRCCGGGCLQDDKNVNWSQERYEEITKNMAGYLKKIGYNPEKGDGAVVLRLVLGL
jgi:hypothetical protein